MLKSIKEHSSHLTLDHRLLPFQLIPWDQLISSKESLKYNCHKQPLCKGWYKSTTSCWMLWNSLPLGTFWGHFSIPPSSENHHTRAEERGDMFSSGYIHICSACLQHGSSGNHARWRLFLLSSASTNTFLI